RDSFDFARDDDWSGGTSREKTRTTKKDSRSKDKPNSRQIGDNGAADNFSLARGQFCYSHPRCSRDDHGQRIKVEDRQPTIKKEGERVPLERHEEVRMKKCHGRSCRTAGQTGMTGQRMKQTDRPRQFR